ncbi:putative transcriptional regulator [Pseudokineococcus lusitanus]|uniref:Putative transcriptional regulator n=1 Tax=Pseudokineococcus lusitanus TaxID=763993 RepID=A0A3N1HN51_9ACTN|nr:putative transcriptional regulator [Pseudokineococcus lusitanus]
MALPALEQDEFRRTVVLLLHHDDEGATGVVLNRPMPVRVDAVLPPWQEHVSAPARLFRGGPVGLDSALGLVVVPGDGPEPPGVRRLHGALGLVDLDADPGTVSRAGSGVRVFAGSAGWGPGQLEGELVDGAWLVLDAEAGDAVTPDPGGLWRAVLGRQPGRLRLLASFPADPSHN